MKLYGLIGKTIGHSQSPALFAEIFRREGLTDHEYRLFPLNSIDLLTALLNNEYELLGVNITLPYKKAIVPYLNEVSDEAARTGAVNTVRIVRKQGQLHLSGYNTDVTGFAALFDKASMDRLVPGAMILGNGGAASAVSYVLNQRNIPYITIARRDVKDRTFESVSEKDIRSYPLIINTTPLGMFPDTGSAPPLPYHLLKPENTLVDLVYNPAETLFMIRGLDAGASAYNGMLMLKAQAEAAWALWKG